MENDLVKRAFLCVVTLDINSVTRSAEKNLLFDSQKNLSCHTSALNPSYIPIQKKQKFPPL